MRQCGNNNTDNYKHDSRQRPVQLLSSTNHVSLVLLQGYVEDLVTYVKTLKASWKDYPDYDTTRSAFLVVEVVKMFSGDEYVGCVGTEKTGGGPTWLKLKWGVAIASRTLDAWTAAKNGFQVDMVRQPCRACFTSTFRRI